MKVFWVQGMCRTGAGKKMVQYVIYLVAPVLLLKQQKVATKTLIQKNIVATLFFDKMHYRCDPTFIGHCCVLQNILSHLLVIR